MAGQPVIVLLCEDGWEPGNDLILAKQFNGRGGAIRRGVRMDANAYKQPMSFSGASSAEVRIGDSQFIPSTHSPCFRASSICSESRGNV